MVSVSSRRTRLTLNGKDIRLIHTSRDLVHTVGAPLAHTSPVKTHMMWKLYQGFSELKRGDIKFVQASVTSISSVSQTMKYQDAGGNSQNLDYDYIIISSGLRRPWPVVPRSSKMISYLKEASAFTEKIAGAGKLGVVVVGGGM
jgi:NADH dehydrogenase FAD-containing subunit